MRTMKRVGVLAVLAWAASAQAYNEGSGLRGGGESVDLENRPQLRDLVDNTACRWKPASMVIEGLPAFQAGMAALDETHWYLADAIRREAGYLSVCMTGMLKKIRTEDEDAVTIYVGPRARQVAIRLNDMIFIDETIMTAMPEADQGFLLVHEIIHSFIPLDAKTRNDKVRSIVRGIYENSVKRMTREEFATYVVQNDLELTPDTDRLDAVRAELLVLLNPKTTERQKLAAFAVVGEERVNSGLTPEDVAFVWDRVRPAYDQALSGVVGGSLELVKNAVERGVRADLGYYGGRSLLEVAVERGNDDVVAYLLSSTQTEAPPFGLTPAENVLLRVIRGELRTMSLDLIFAKGVDANAVVTLRGQVTTLLGASIVADRLDIAERLLAQPDLRRETVVEAMELLVQKNSQKASLLATQLLDSGVFPIWWALADGRTLVRASYDAENLGLLGILIGRGADVNARGTDGKTVFDLALERNDIKAAKLISGAKGFTYVFRPRGSVAEAHQQALDVLYQLIELDIPLAVQSLVNGHRFTWFDLQRAQEIAKLKGRVEIATILKEAQRK